jgi:hypothetical protein
MESSVLFGTWGQVGGGGRQPASQPSSDSRLLGRQTNQPVRGLRGGHRAAAAEAAAVDRDAARPDRDDGPDVDEQQDAGDDRGDPRTEPDEQQQGEGDLQERHAVADRLDQRLRQDPVDADRLRRRLGIGHLGQTRPRPDHRQGESHGRADPGGDHCCSSPCGGRSVINTD